MSNNYLTSLSLKYNIPVTELEKHWEHSKSVVDKQKYNKPEIKYATITKVFKNMINKEYNLNESLFLDFDDAISIIKLYK